ncbi:uncharacterized protein LOC129742728 [Uranotaenia lowii]|uniref:uncharacterized protein LOC129742728 n=1 Tax=Uranotaenia lowii TaxID=190385 RepID=UPI002478D2E3|nr:uncharacterized protein LOC129742728 [Uranotaenia lowii]
MSASDELATKLRQQLAKRTSIARPQCPPPPPPRLREGPPMLAPIFNRAVSNPEPKIQKPTVDRSTSVKELAKRFQSQNSCNSTSSTVRSCEATKNFDNHYDSAASSGYDSHIYEEIPERMPNTNFQEHDSYWSDSTFDSDTDTEYESIPEESEVPRKLTNQTLTKSFLNEGKR